MSNSRKAISVVGLQWGDEGKTATIDRLTSLTNASLVIKIGSWDHSGSVQHPNSDEIIYCQFAAGHNRGVNTHISEFYSFNPIALHNEALYHSKRDGYNAYKSLTISPNSLVVTPLHMRAEIQKDIAHSSGFGYYNQGVSRADSDPALSRLYAKDLHSLDAIKDKLTIQSELCGGSLEEVNRLADLLYTISGQFDLVPTVDIMDDHDNVIFENSHGVLRDAEVGIYPYNYTSNVNGSKSADLATLGGYELHTVGVTRTYQQAFFPQETKMLNPKNTGLAYRSESHITLKNYHRIPQPLKHFAGIFDLGLYDYAITSVQPRVDSVVLTHADPEYLEVLAKNPYCYSPSPAFVKELKSAANKALLLSENIKYAPSLINHKYLVQSSSSKELSTVFFSENLIKEICMISHGSTSTDYKMNRHSKFNTFIESMLTVKLENLSTKKEGVPINSSTTS